LTDDRKSDTPTGGSLARSVRSPTSLASAFPSYSPDLAPIEHAWSKIKTYVRATQARPREALELAIQQALTTMTSADAHDWFTYCGDTVPYLENRWRPIARSERRQAGYRDPFSRGT
jgi:hypothetical protein